MFFPDYFVAGSCNLYPDWLIVDSEVCSCLSDIAVVIFDLHSEVFGYTLDTGLFVGIGLDLQKISSR